MIEHLPGQDFRENLNIKELETSQTSIEPIAGLVQCKPIQYSCHIQYTWAKGGHLRPSRFYITTLGLEERPILEKPKSAIFLP